ncbi:endonuclease I family protein, partial [Nodularia spumigena]|uniref:endonuclease I family protein n=1 Tax=Nodularia spumigena TaxID=70799 RepID=UPI002B218849
DINGDQVFCLYTGFTATYDSTNTGVTASTQVYQSGAGINAEHIWPQSKFSEASPMVYDLHHLFAARVQANGDRSNYPFMNVTLEDVSFWYLDATKTAEAPILEEQHLYSKYKSNTGFEPRDDYKGDVARAVFYFYAMYKDHPNMTANAENVTFFDGMKSTLLTWHRQDVPDAKELARNTKVAAWQGNRNPFIDDTSLVARAFFSTDKIEAQWTGNEGWRMSGVPFGKTYQQMYGSIGPKDLHWQILLKEIHQSTSGTQVRLNSRQSAQPLRRHLMQ